MKIGDRVRWNDANAADGACGTITIIRQAVWRTTRPLYTFSVDTKKGGTEVRHTEVHVDGFDERLPPPVTQIAIQWDDVDKADPIYWYPVWFNQDGEPVGNHSLEFL